ncbi:MAG: tetratricopeptide repeat protein [Sphingomonadales bacterium]|nr:tetratricopeptide repeat protein [Sphingomonadales bacterium]
MNKLLILPALLALAACADSPEKSLSKGKAAYTAHDYAAARVYFASALAGTPGDKAILLLQARTLIALGDGEGARTALAALAGDGPPTGELAELTAEAALLRKAPDAALEAIGQTGGAEAERLRALAAIQKGDMPGAVNHMERGVAAGGNARLFADYARLRLLSGDMAGASALADRAAKAEPDGIDSLLIGAQIAVRRGDLKQSLELYQRATKLYPNSLAALTGQAAVLGDLGRKDEMTKVVDQAAAFAPHAPAVLFLRAKAAADAKDWAGVRSVVQPVETSLDQVDPLRVLYGEALLRLGQSELAAAQLAPVVRAMPGNRDAVRLLAETRLQGGDARGAVAMLKPLADLPYARPEELALMARAAKAAGNPDAATYEARSRQPQPQALGRDLADADVAMRAGNWAGAAESYRRILAVTDGKNVLVLNNLANAELMLGNLGQAQELADKALRLAPGNASVLDTAGWVRIKAGKDLENARRLLRQGAQQAPGNATIRAHLAEAERAGT